MADVDEKVEVDLDAGARVLPVRAARGALVDVELALVLKDPVDTVRDPSNLKYVIIEITPKLLQTFQNIYLFHDFFVR